MIFLLTVNHYIHMIKHVCMCVKLVNNGARAQSDVFILFVLSNKQSDI